MYSIRTTPGFIIGSNPFGEAGKTLIIFTRDLGLIRARAIGIRLEKSKLRYHASEYSFGTFSLVKGKESWRLTSAQSLAREDIDGKNARDECKVVTKNVCIRSHHGQIMIRVALLLRRLLQGEQSHPELYNCVFICHIFLQNTSKLTEEQLLTSESLVVIRILKHLGYIGGNQYIYPYLTSDEITVELLDELTGKRSDMNKSINTALQASHL